MKKIKNSITNRFVKWFVIIVIIPMIIINMVTYHYYLKLYEKQYIESAFDSMQHVSVNIEEMLQNYIRKAAAISYSRELRSILAELLKSSDRYTRISAATDMNTFLNINYNYSQDINSILFILSNGQYYQYGQQSKMTIEDMKQTAWYKNIQKNRDTVQFVKEDDSIYESGNGRNNVVLAVAPKNIVNDRILFEKTSLSNSLEVVLLSFNIDMLYRSQYEKKQLGNMLIMNHTSEIVGGSLRDVIGHNANDIPYLKKIEDIRNSDTKVLHVDGKIVSVLETDRFGWTIINVIDEELLYNKIYKMIKLVNTIYLVMIIVFMLFCVYFFKSIILPLRKLMQQMKKAEKGELLQKHQGIGSYGEIAELETAYYDMVEKIYNLMIERDMKEKERSKEEIKALQAQINPHFIYNTLNSIRLMAMISKKDNIKNMTDAFMKLLKATFRGAGKMVHVREELECLKHYLYIMDVRYSNKFKVVFDIKEEIMDLAIMRLLLQPIVENAILHGVSQTNGKGTIEIKGYIENESLLFIIKDNGRGMTETQIKTILSNEHNSKDGFNRIGIGNIVKRIQLNYGNQYGIKIDSMINEYTLVTVEVPIIKDFSE